MKNGLIRTCATGLVVTALTLGGCTWVKVTAEGENVKVLSVAQAQNGNCERLGRTTSTVKDNVGFIKRRDTKVETELQSLARNEAAQMGGNAVAAEGKIEEGQQKFIVYRCP